MWKVGRSNVKPMMTKDDSQKFFFVERDGSRCAHNASPCVENVRDEIPRGPENKKIKKKIEKTPFSSSAVDNGGGGLLSKANSFFK